MHTQTIAATKSWSTRRGEKARRMALVAPWLSGPVLPQDRIADALEALIAPRDRIVIEGDKGSRAFDLLVVLLEARGALVSKERIMRRLRPTTVVEECNPRQKMALLRKALGSFRDANKTVSGRGYVFAADMETVDTHAWVPTASPNTVATGGWPYIEAVMDVASFKEAHVRLREPQAELAYGGRLTTLGALAAGIHPVFFAYANEADNLLPTTNWSTRHGRLAR